jgi:phosphotransferase system  glucose/maltose/N-acetylglucosamine-specific IIC component
MDKLVSWVQQAPQTNIPLLVAIVGIFSALLAGFFSVIVWPFVKLGIENIYTLLLLTENYGITFLITPSTMNNRGEKYWN